MGERYRQGGWRKKIGENDRQGGTRKKIDEIDRQGGWRKKWANATGKAAGGRK